MTKDNIKLMEQSQKLAYHIANRFYTGDHFDDDDIRQVALIGLWKATKTWDKERSAFSTYAYKVITNEILQEVKKRKRKKIDTFSYDAYIESCEGEVSYLDLLASPVNEMEFIEVSMDFSKAFELLSEKEKNLLAIYISNPNITQQEVANKMHVTQGCISKIRKKVRQKILFG